jgi:hypothetical protein
MPEDPPKKQFIIRTKRSQKLVAGDVTLQVYGKLFCTASLNGLASKELDEFMVVFEKLVGIPCIVTNYPIDIKMLEIVEVPDKPEEPEPRTRFERINEE